MSLEKIDAIIEALRYERYQWLPARRTYIPKKNGKKRPLGMPVWSDKLVQEVIRLILEAYYEPQFSDHSHGFRPERGCHTALREIYYGWTGTTWFIEGDISQCFDKLDHELLLTTLSEKIQDGGFINLLRELFEAGYMEEWTLNQTLSGVPQGGIVSPILSNILLDKLDQYVESVLIPRYTKGARRKDNPEYKRLMKNFSYHHQRGNAEKAEIWRQQAQSMPSMEVNDPDFRRLKYVRYADDFLLGFVGPKSEAEEIKQQVGTFLQEELKLELSQTKTLITHARSEAARFLGYEVTNLQNDTKRCVDRNGSNRRNINGKIGLRIPQDVIEEKCQRYMREGKAVHRGELQQEQDYTIVMTYQLEYRGIANYYQSAYNLSQLNKLKWIMGTSLLKTLANKHKTSVARVAKKYEAKLTVGNKEYQVLQVTLMWAKRSELVQRLLVGCCELCGATENTEVHHIRAMKHLHEYPGREKPEWVKRMIALKRKTLILCRTCHEDVTYGRPLRRQTIKLADVKALQKATRCYWKAVCGESRTYSLGGGSRKSTSNGNSPASYLTLWTEQRWHSQWTV
jgi:group II intron reverse transcriptase/maturase